ncbi:MAG: sigma-54 dependent transcriptional regulator [Leptospiraceae bacterium]|nr:sigma-54 dependent transcriptional regulator [Leptospiraceae bacterium]MDW7975280.1 sigma-54 dependent transcriptional regulator [Leptospiraceae bacterium]
MKIPSHINEISIKLFRNGWLSRKQLRQLENEILKSNILSEKEFLEYIKNKEWIDEEDLPEIQILIKQEDVPRDFHFIPGSLNPRMEEVYKIARKMAEVDTTLLILGESGVGKTKLARMIHERSPRKNKPFVTVSCGSIPENLLESELFGVEKGAYTGAHKSRDGKFKVADGGTIFLDEIAELPLNLQVKLLRVLQDKTIVPLGSAEEVFVDVRVIAATNKDLEDLVKKGLFREDLYYRLNVVPLVMLPLRERKEDIESLTNYFLEQFKKKYKKPYSIKDPLLWKILKEYQWPGNIRELENTIERLCVLSENGELKVEDLPQKILNKFDKNALYKLKEETNESTKQVMGFPKLEDLEKEHILRTLIICNGKISEAANLLGLHRNTLRNKIQKYQLKKYLKEYSKSSKS